MRVNRYGDHPCDVATGSKSLPVASICDPEKDVLMLVDERTSIGFAQIKQTKNRATGKPLQSPFPLPVLVNFYTVLRQSGVWLRGTLSAAGSPIITYVLLLTGDDEHTHSFNHYTSIMIQYIFIQNTLVRIHLFRFSIRSIRYSRRTYAHTTDWFAVTSFEGFQQIFIVRCTVISSDIRSV